jgi:hypothetical protein
VPPFNRRVNRGTRIGGDPAGVGGKVGVAMHDRGPERTSNQQGQ